MADANSIAMFCDQCNDDRSFERKTIKETVSVRKRDVTVNLPIIACSVCGWQQPDPDQDDLRLIYDAYRRQEGLLATEEIVRIREKYNLSREAFAAVLGMSPTSLYRYEDGALQDELHDSMMFACDDPDTMRRLIDRRKSRLSSLQLSRFEAAWTKEKCIKDAFQSWSDRLRNALKEDKETRSRVAEHIRSIVHQIFTLDLHLPAPMGNADWDIEDLKKFLFVLDLESQRERGHTLTGVDLHAERQRHLGEGVDVLGPGDPVERKHGVEALRSVRLDAQYRVFFGAAAESKPKVTSSLKPLLLSAINILWSTTKRAPASAAEQRPQRQVGDAAPSEREPSKVDVFDWALSNDILARFNPVAETDQNDLFSQLLLDTRQSVLAESGARVSSPEPKSKRRQSPGHKT